MSLENSSIQNNEQIFWLTQVTLISKSMSPFTEEAPPRTLFNLARELPLNEETLRSQQSFVLLLCWEQTNLSSSSQHMGLHSFIAQLVEHCSANTEVMGSNPVVSVFTQFKSTSFHISTKVAYPFMLFYLFRAWPTHSSGTRT